MSDRLSHPAISRRSVLKGAGGVALAAAAAPKLGLLTGAERADAVANSLGTDLIGCIAQNGPADSQAFDALLPFSTNKAMTSVDAWTTPSALKQQNDRLTLWHGSPRTVIWTINILGVNDDLTDQTLAAGANHDYDMQFTNLAKKIVFAGRQTDMFRIGHEFNGNKFRWQAAGAAQAATFVAFLRNIVTAMRKVYPDFYFIWCPAISPWNHYSLAGDLAQYYPGDDFIDGIGLDVYDQDPVYSFNQLLTEHNAGLNRDGFGLNWLEQFSAAHNKLMFFPEWGLDPLWNASKGRPSDNPAFITDMANWMFNRFTSIWNADYWQLMLANGVPASSFLSSTSNPKSFAAFKTAFNRSEF